MGQIHRITPALPAHLRSTYLIAQPPATHTRVGTCEEAECGALARGWITRVDETTDLGQAQAHHIRVKSGRRFAESRTPEGLTQFTFVAGQSCFVEHRVSLERDPVFAVVGGDHRGNPREEKRIHSGPDAWVDDFATRLDNLNKARE